MAADRKAAQHCLLSPAEHQVLSARQHQIVILRRKAGVAANAAPVLGQNPRQ